MFDKSVKKRIQPRIHFFYWRLFVLLLAAAGCQRGEELGPVANPTSAAKIRSVFTSETDSAASSEEGTGDSAGDASTGWATLKGRFVYDGEPPVMKPYNVNKDQATCTDGGKPPLQETLLVDSDTKGIANVAIYLRKASRVHESVQPQADKVIFDQKMCVFRTHVLPLTIGQIVELKNSDPVGHNTNISGNNGFNQTIPAHESVDYTPQKEEPMPVLAVCSIHPWMVSYLLPRANGYYAITAADGTFEIPNLPAGEVLEVQVWHESATGPKGALVLATDAGKELKWSKKGRFKIKLAADEVKELDLTVPADAFGG